MNDFSGSGMTAIPQYGLSNSWEGCCIHEIPVI